MPLSESMGKEFIKRGSVRSSHSSLNIPIFFDRNEKVKVLLSPGLKMLLGCKNKRERKKLLLKCNYFCCDDFKFTHIND